jgi:signal transduction histidine kinase
MEIPASDNQPPAPNDRTTASGIDFDVFAAGAGARMLRILAVVFTAGLLVSAGIHYWKYQEIVSPALYPHLLIMMIALLMVRRGWYRIAMHTFLWSVIVTSTYAAINVNGILSPILMIMPLLVLFGAQFFNRKAALILTLMIFLALTLVLLLQLDGRYVNSIQRDPQFVYIALLAICMFAYVLGDSSARGLREQFSNALRLSHELALLNSKLEQTVAARTAELSKALENLQRTQDDLIQSEKLASLGSLVAGISHELNTPIGNAVTVSSALSDRARSLRSSFEDNRLKRSEFTNGLVALEEMSQLIERSANRAATLITSFKQVAIDQVSERRRTFDLSEVIEENLATLRTGIKHQPWVIDNQVQPGIICDSFPGPLGQVLTNLIQNSILHGFADREHGRIEISANVDNGLLQLVVSDDGVGMSTATAVRIFEPFFTTRLGKGGSGLGLSICHRITTTILAGELRAVSTAGSGTSFTLSIPLRTPGTV